MQPIAIITTGGTFNKRYDPIRGTLVVDPTTRTVDAILDRWQIRWPTHACIGKDSLEMDRHDRDALVACVRNIDASGIVIVHGTDTMDASAHALSQAHTGKTIVLTGAMVPYAIDPVEATANLASALGALEMLERSGVFIAMNGRIGPYDRIEKDRRAGHFIRKE
jgi:L-asparaginase